jgi:valyl-tRNA synthetase
MARTLRAESKLDPKQQLRGVAYARGEALQLAERGAEAIQKLANVELDFRAEATAYAGGAAAVRSTAQFDLVLELPQAQQEAQRRRLEKDREQLVKNVVNSKRQLGDETFLSKAPPQVVESIRKKLVEYEEQLRKIEEALGGRP